MTSVRIRTMPVARVRVPMYVPKKCPSCRANMRPAKVGDSGRGYFCDNCFTSVQIGG